MMESRLRQLSTAGYGLGFMLLAIPLLELSLGTWPPRPSMVNWRFGVVGLFANSLLLPTLGAAILLTSAAALGHLRVLRALALIALLACAAELSILLLFGLDIVQMRAMIQSEVKLGFDLAALKSVFSLFMGSVVLAALGVTGWKASRPHREATSHAQQTKGGGLLVRSAALRKTTSSIDGDSERDRPAQGASGGVQESFTRG